MGSVLMFLVFFAWGQGPPYLAGTLFNLCLGVMALSLPLAGAGMVCAIVALLKREEPLPVGGITICVLGLFPGAWVVSTLMWSSYMTSGSR